MELSLNIFWFQSIQAALLLPPVPWELKVSVLLFNLRDSRPAKLTTPLNKVKRLLQRCLDSPLMYGENFRPRPLQTVYRNLQLNAFSDWVWNNPPRIDYCVR